MLRSLVGSEMCIRDRGKGYDWNGHRFTLHAGPGGFTTVSGVLPPGITLRDAIEATGYDSTPPEGSFAAGVNNFATTAQDRITATLTGQTVEQARLERLGGADAVTANIQQRLDENDDDGPSVQRDLTRGQSAEADRYAAIAAAYESGDAGSSYGSPTSNREGSGTGGQARSGESVSSDHDWSAANDGGLIAMNVGGMAMPIYRQTGGTIQDAAGNVQQLANQAAQAAQQATSAVGQVAGLVGTCLLYTSPSPRDS